MPAPKAAKSFKSHTEILLNPDTEENISYIGSSFSSIALNRLPCAISMSSNLFKIASWLFDCSDIYAPAPKSDRLLMGVAAPPPSAITTPAAAQDEPKLKLLVIELVPATATIS